MPLDVGIAKNPHVFPEWLGTPVAQQMRSGNYLDWLANCPYEMHDLLEDAVLASLIYSLKEDHKENFYYSAIQLLQSQEVANHAEVHAIRKGIPAKEPSHSGGSFGDRTVP